MEVSVHGNTTDVPDVPLLASLRLLVPPLRLISAVLWRLVQQQDVIQYGMLADFVSLVTESVPELFSPTNAVQLVLGLRAKLILELCYRDEAALIPPHLHNVQSLLRLVKPVESSAVREAGDHFVELVETLMKDADQREDFFQNVFPVEFGPAFDSALQRVLWDFLSRLEHFLPVPDLLQTASWIGSESSAREDCEESIRNPESLRSLLHHHKCLGHLDTFVSSASRRDGDCILSALSGKRPRVSQTNAGDAPPAPPPHSDMSMCLMDTTDVETVIVTSDWTGLGLHPDQDEDDPRPGADPAECKGNAEELAENPVKDPTLEHSGCRSAGEEPGRGAEETPKVPVTRRSARKPKQTWKLKLVQLQTQKRKRERRRRSSGNVAEIRGEQLADGDAAERLGSPDDITSDRNAELSSRTFSCPQCSFTHVQERYVKSHMKKVHPLSSAGGEKEPHVCGECGKGYRYPGMLRAHERSHTGEQPFQCTASHCGRRFSYVQALRRHRSVHGHQKSSRGEAGESLADAEADKADARMMYACLYCGERFSSLSARREHHKTHPEDELKRCSECGKRLSCQAALIRHKRGHVGERQHRCLLCGSGFACATSFKRHMMAHKPERPYRCSCGKGFTYKGALVSHQRTHTAERRYRCSRCGRCFLYPGELRKHERTHSDEKPFLCPHCGKRFKRERILRAHVAGHTRDKIFKCSTCDKTFSYKASLTRHELTHTGERPFLCSDCGKTFFSFGELLKHQRYHTGIKPFQCAHCDKSFTQACYLQLHTRYHTGVRPYTCPQCGKSFFTSCRLKRHAQIHTDDKPFQCAECGKRFRQAYVLKVHRRTHLHKDLA